MQGYVQVYTGNGKGKTTAAFGLALRAAGANLKVFIGQFVKGGHYSELNSLAHLSEFVTIKQFGLGFIYSQPTGEDYAIAQEGLKEINSIIYSLKYQVVILDEINIALKYNLVALDEVLYLIRNRPDSVELVLTGRDAPPEVIEEADLVTEMREIKHYASKGVGSRLGIEK